jgi:hypothetical protein
MATLDDLYTQLGQAKKGLAPLQTALQQQRDTWHGALTQLGLAGTWSGARSPVRPPTKPTKPYAVTDLPTLATAYLQAQTALNTAQALVNGISAQIQAAIAAKGAA